MNVTEKLAEFLVEISLEDIPSLPRETAKLCLLDWLGVSLAGFREPLGEILFDLIGEMGGQPQASLVGRGTKTSLLHAVLVNGSISHALDYDDVHLGMMGHPTVPVAPAVLALGEWKGASGRKVLEAFCLGVEAECRISGGVSPSHYMRGFHATGTLGAFGAAVASGKLLKLDREKMVHALGLAGTQAAGVRQVFGTMAKPFHAGKAAMNGLMAALLAEKGFTCSREIIEGPMGFGSCLSLEKSPEKILDGLGSRFEVSDVQFKWHASCFQTHPAVDAALALGKRLPASDIQEVSIFVHPSCSSVANIENPSTGLEGKFSIPHCTALALITGRTDESQFTDEVVVKGDLKEVRRRVRLTNDDGLSSHLAKIVVRLKDGRTYKAEADTLALGRDPAVRKERVEEKFLRLAEPVLGLERTDALFKRMKDLEAVADVSELPNLWSA